MTTCIDITQEMLPDAIRVRINDSSLDFQKAKQEADDRAHRDVTDPMLLAWFDRKQGKFSPDVICCDTTKPSWLVYAESRGGNFAIDINDLEYVFVYASFPT